VSLATIKRWLKRRRETGDVETPPQETFSKVKARLKKEAAHQ
jgi:transposase